MLSIFLTLLMIQDSLPRTESRGYTGFPEGAVV